MNKSIFQTHEAIESMRVAADGYASEAENKSNVTELRNLISKSTALKRGAEEKQSALDGLSEKKKMLLKKKGRVISYCFNVYLATVVLCYIVRVYCEYQVCLGHLLSFFIIFDC